MRDVKAVWSSRPKPKAAPPPEEPTAAPDQLLNDFLSVMTMALRSFNSEAKLKPDLKVIDGGQSDVGPIPQPHVEYAIDTEKLPNGLINQLFLTDTSGSLSGTKAYQFQRNEFGLVESITGEDKTLEILRDANGQLSGIQHV